MYYKFIIEVIAGLRCFLCFGPFIYVNRVASDIHGFKGQTHLACLWKWLHELHSLCVDLDEGQQVPGLNCLKQLDHFSCRRRACLPGILVVHVLSVDELLPHSPVDKVRVLEEKEI